MIPFSKAHACGNDFLIVAEEAALECDWAELTRRLCARTTGVGADGIEFFAWTGPESGRIRLHNADGSIAEISGNGTRCVAAWMAHERNLQPGDAVVIETDAGSRTCSIDRIEDGNEFSVVVTAGMGTPTFALKRVALADGLQIEGVEVSTGNPHFVVTVDNQFFTVDGRPWQQIGAEICLHSDFPQQTNVEFVRIVDSTGIEIRIFERGVGPTTSSGTGTCASATASIALNGCHSPLCVVAPGGMQFVEWKGPGTELQLQGGASLIARGEAFFA